MGRGGTGPDSVLTGALWWPLPGGQTVGVRAEPGTRMEGTQLDQVGDDGAVPGGGGGGEWDSGGGCREGARGCCRRAWPSCPPRPAGATRLLSAPACANMHPPGRSSPHPGSNRETEAQSGRALALTVGGAPEPGHQPRPGAK